MFCGCSKLSSLPNISKWDISKVKFINFMFYKCLELTSLPDISKWNTKNIEDMQSFILRMFKIIIITKYF